MVTLDQVRVGKREVPDAHPSIGGVKMASVYGLRSAHEATRHKKGAGRADSGILAANINYTSSYI